MQEMTFRSATVGVKLVHYVSPVSFALDMHDMREGDR